MQSFVEDILEELRNGLEDSNQSGQILDEITIETLLNPIVEKVLVMILRTLPSQQVGLREGRIDRWVDGWVGEQIMDELMEQNLP